MTEAYAIKPCPFCGSEAAIRWCGGVLLVECTKCGVSKGDTGGEGESEIRASAIAEWNQRVPVTVSEKGEVEALKSAVDDLRSVLCDPEGNACIRGSVGDLAIVEGALQRIDTYLSRGQG